MSLNTFEYNGISSDDYGLVVGEKTIHNGAERDIERIEIPGRNGDLLLDNGRFRNVEIAYTCYVVPGRVNATATLSSVCRDVRAWLCGAGAGYNRLIDTYDPDYFREAAYNAAFELEEWAIEIGYVPIIFDCKPQKFRLDGETETTITEEGSITNPEAFPSEPLIRVYGGGAGVLYVGDYIVTLSDIDTYVDIDCAQQNAFKGTVNKNSTISLSALGFPRLAAGENSVDWTGEITSVTIIPRWWTI